MYSYTSIPDPFFRNPRYGPAFNHPSHQDMILIMSSPVRDSVYVLYRLSTEHRFHGILKSHLHRVEVHHPLSSLSHLPSVQTNHILASHRGPTPAHFLPSQLSHGRGAHADHTIIPSLRLQSCFAPSSTRNFPTHAPTKCRSLPTSHVACRLSSVSCFVSPRP
ncbi:hypothetical protein LZ30DRAFT_246929 [Colletotrichum cereale]|nr:hypothetical protein LZ30DRAFT_246929 [Colletotrichum cereale]